jgi:hypothetical protein
MWRELPSLQRFTITYSKYDRKYQLQNDIFIFNFIHLVDYPMKKLLSIQQILL